MVALHKRVQAGEEAFQAQVVDMEAGLEETRGTFQALDGQMRALSHAAAKIGDRLQARRAPRCAARAVRATAGRLGEGARWARATACSSGCCARIGFERQACRLW